MKFRFKNKNLIKNIIDVVIVIAVALLVYQGLNFFSLINSPEVSLPEPIEIERNLTTTDESMVPQRLIIPKLGVDSEVERVGRARDGSMAVPVEFENSGWYREGFLPGDSGKAVFAGHLDDGKGDPAVFYNLSELREGDSVIVRGEKGLIEYKVTDSRIYDYNLEDTREIFGASEESMLALITCDGAWLSGERTYDSRLVVFAEIVMD